MPRDDAQVRLSDAEHIVDALNEAIEFEGTLDERAQFLLHALTRLLERRCYAAIFLIESLERKPVPLVVKRFFVGDSADREPLVDDEHLQQAAEKIWRPIVELIVPKLLDNIRVPFTFIVSKRFGDTDWFKNDYLPAIQAHGYVDSLVSAWAASPGRAIVFSVRRTADDPPFTDDDCTVMSLMLRATAPFVDREIFNGEDPLSEFDLTRRQKEVLMQILGGQNPQQIAKNLHRSVHTVNKFVHQLYDRFNVSSRGELMAMFIDRTVARAAAANPVQSG